jgi:DNA-binding transcriptional MerR regulator
MVLNKNKDLKLYYSISEVAQMFNVSETLLRFWEKEFPQISPKRSEGNHRLYTQNEIEQIKVIKYLLHEQKMKIEGAKILFEKNYDEIRKRQIITNKLRKVKKEISELRKTFKENVQIITMSEEQTEAIE